MRRLNMVQKTAGAALVVMLAAVVGLAAATPAFAYFNRGALKVEAAASSLEVQAGKKESLTLKVTPSSDKQTEGCGMPKCPQGCSDSCFDKNGQCTCAGKKYKTYHAQVVATSSNPGVAVATATSKGLTVYAKSAGETTITLHASLRQYSDATCEVKVHVSGVAADAAGTAGSYTEIPAAAEASAQDADADDELDIHKATIMNRAVWEVRINSAADPTQRMREMAGTDGDLTFWSGDTYFHPAYSLTFGGKHFSPDEVTDTDPSITAERAATGELTQPLSGLDGFLVLRLAQQGAFCSTGKAYVLADDLFKDSDELGLFTFDAETQTFKRIDDSDIAMVGGYVAFSVSGGGTYVVSTRDLEHDAAQAVKRSPDAKKDTSEGCSDMMDAGSMDMSDADMPDDGGEVTDSGMPLVVPAAVGVIAVAAVAIVLVARRKKRAGDEGGTSAGDGAGSSDRKE